MDDPVRVGRGDEDQFEELAIHGRADDEETILAVHLDLDHAESVGDRLHDVSGTDSVLTGGVPDLLASSLA